MVRGKNPRLSRGIGQQSSDDEQYVSQSQAGQVGKSGQVLSARGRPAFSENVVNKNYNVCYSNAENNNKLGWRLVDLGRAGAIVAITLFGFEVSLEDNAEIDRKSIFLSADYYALSL
jgi:hypothetical protein